MTFLIQQINTVRDKISTSHWCFQSCLIFIKKLFKRFFKNHNSWFLCYHFLNATKLIAICNWIFYVSDFMYQILCIRFYVSDFRKLVMPITITFVFNLTVVPKPICSYWFVITFFRLKTFPNISVYSVFDCSNCFFF